MGIGAQVSDRLKSTKSTCNIFCVSDLLYDDSQGDVINPLEGHAARLLAHGPPKDLDLKKNQGGQR